MFKEICINEEMLSKYTFEYINIHVCIYVYMHEYIIIKCLFVFVLRDINILGHLMPNQVLKSGETERSVMLEFIIRERICRKNLVLLKVGLKRILY